MISLRKARLTMLFNNLVWIILVVAVVLQGCGPDIEVRTPEVSRSETIQLPASISIPAQKYYVWTSDQAYLKVFRFETDDAICHTIFSNGISCFPKYQ